MNEDKQAIEDFKLVWDFCLDQGICVGAYKLGENGEPLKLIGTNFLFVSTEDSEKAIIDLMVSKKCLIQKSNFNEIFLSGAIQITGGAQNFPGHGRPVEENRVGFSKIMRRKDSVYFRFGPGCVSELSRSKTRRGIAESSVGIFYFEFCVLLNRRLFNQKGRHRPEIQDSGDFDDVYGHRLANSSRESKLHFSARYGVQKCGGRKREGGISRDQG